MRHLACGLLLSGVIGSTALAQPEPVDNYFPDRLSGWRFQIEPFGILPIKTDGNVQVGDRQIPFDVGLGDVLDHLDMALNLRFEAWKHRWGIILNGQHYWTGSEFTTPDGMSTFEHNTRIGLGSALIARRFGAYDINDDVSFSIDVEAGAWVGRIHSTLDMSDGFSRSENEIFPKAMLAARPILRITPSWAVINRNALYMPDISWTVMLGAEYDWRWLAIEFGYSAERLVLQKNVVKFAANINGPYIGIGFRWGAGLPY